MVIGLVFESNFPQLAARHPCRRGIGSILESFTSINRGIKFTFASKIQISIGYYLISSYTLDFRCIFYQTVALDFNLMLVLHNHDVKNHKSCLWITKTKDQAHLATTLFFSLMKYKVSRAYKTLYLAFPIKQKQDGVKKA